jgi:uncharacterized 2Fe-2S/4Fe-4S cluster protein (DUF4445 family)
MARVTFYLDGKTIETEVEQRVTLLEAASRAGVYVNSICGGEGICGTCKVLIKAGQIRRGPTSLLTREEIEQGYVLACQTKVLGDVEVEIPLATRIVDGQILVDKDAEKLRSIQAGGEEISFERSPLVDKLSLTLPEPSLTDNLSDHQRIYRELSSQKQAPILQTGLTTLRKIPTVLRDNQWAVTATLGTKGDITELLQVEGGDTTGRNYGVAVDIGTSTVVVHLLDLNTSKTVDGEAKYNSQMKYGEDVTRRIIHADEEGTEQLHSLIIDDINGLISTLIFRNKVRRDEVTSVICSGNTTMLHFLINLPASGIRKSPYVSASTSPPPIRAAEVGVKINPRGLLYVVPMIGGWVGGDITAGILACGIDKSEKLSLLIDIGTNGEMVIGNKDWMVTCSASAGPAFEGTGVESGMRASRGAIEHVTIKDRRIEYSTIGDGSPRGICGSGLIDLVAVLFKARFINRRGVFNPGRSDRIRARDGQPEFVMVPGSETETGKDIVITQPDIENLMRAKAAIYAGANILIKRLGLEFDDFERILIAGGFGSYLDRRKTQILGLIPDIPLERIKFVGNTSIIGAKMALLSREALDRCHGIADAVTYIDLISFPNYYDHFMAAMFLPHTDLEMFPTVTEELNQEVWT